MPLTYTFKVLTGCNNNFRYIIPLKRISLERIRFNLKANHAGYQLLPYHLDGQITSIFQIV